MFEFTQATRKGTPALISLWGPSASGKTYSALLLARGLVGGQGKIGLLDTENGRAEFYASLAGGWLHADLQPPFTPARYTAAMDAAVEAGLDVIIIDSASHVWEGEGGVLDMADANGKKGLLKWQKPKMEYKRMMNSLLRSRTHVIFCLRAKEKVVQITDSNGRQQIISEGLTPISEKNFKFEMTVDVQLDDTHLPVRIKCPEELAPALPVGKMLTIETGQMIAEWIGGGAPVDHDVAALMKVARDVATLGNESLRRHWDMLSKAERQTLASILPELKHIAADVDSQAGPAPEAPSSDPLDDPFTNTGAPPHEMVTAEAETITEPEPEEPAAAEPDPLDLPEGLERNPDNSLKRPPGGAETETVPFNLDQGDDERAMAVPSFVLLEDDDGEPDFQAFAGEMITAIGSAPDKAWLGALVEKHEKTLTLTWKKFGPQAETNFNKHIENRLVALGVGREAAA